MASAAAYDDPARTRKAAAPERAPADVVAVRVAGALLAVALLGFSALWSQRAPFGVWENRLFGQPAWNEGDPGAFYVTSAHQLSRGQTPLFIGHPGAPLTLLLREIQRAYHSTASPSELGYTDFIVRNLPTTYLLSKLAMTLLHLVSLGALFRCARALLASEGAALFATAGYATSLPVFYYLSRISVEPLMMLCFFTAFPAIWRCQELARAGRRSAAFAHAGLAGLAAATGAVTKLHFLGPLPFFLALYILLGERRVPPHERIAWSTRAQACLILLGVSAATLIFWSQWIDWRTFTAIWRSIVATTPKPEGWSLLPAATPQGALPLCELAFVALGAAGFIGFLRSHPARRSRALWLSGYAGFALLFFAYRVVLAQSFLPFHYFFLANGVIAVFFGSWTASALSRLSLPDASLRAVLTGLALVALLHGLAIGAVVASRRHDAAEYASRRPIFDLIAGLEPRQRLGVSRSVYEWPVFRGSLMSLPGFPLLPSFPLDRCPLIPRFEALFEPIGPSQLLAAKQRLFVPALGAEVIVVDAKPGDAG